MAPLSTTTMTGFLKSAKFEDFCSSTEQHFKNNPEDVGSAVKAVKAVAWFLYENSISGEQRRPVIETVITSVNIITRFEQNVAVIKDIGSSLYHITTRLDKQGKDLLLLADFVPVVLSLYEVLSDGTALYSMAYNLYGALWNFTITNEPRAKSEAEVIALIKVQYVALQFQMMNPASEKFSYTKLVSKTKNVSNLFAEKVPGDSPKLLLADNLLKLLHHPAVVKSERAQFWELWSFAVSFSFKYNLDTFLRQILEVKTSKGEILGDKKVMEFLSQVKSLSNKSDSATISSLSGLNLSNEYIVLTLNLLVSLYGEVSETLLQLRNSNPQVLNATERGIISLCSQCTETSSIVLALKVLGTFENLEMKDGTDVIKTRVEILGELFDAHENLVRALDRGDGDESVKKNAIAKLTQGLYSVGCALDKESSSAEEFVRRCCLWSPRIVELDPTFPRESLYPRWKMLFEIQYKVAKLKDALVSLSLGMVYLVTSDLKKQLIQDKLIEIARYFWVKVRIKWMMLEKESMEKKDGEKKDDEKDEEYLTDMNIVTILRSSSAGVQVPEAVLQRLLTWEIYAYRQVYAEGTDLRETTVKCLTLLMELDNSKLTKALALLEQTNIYWFGDNIEDLEMGAKCCEKARSVLSELEGVDSYLGISLYLRFLCEHRLLQIQIANEINEEREKKVLEGRREVDGLNKGNEVVADNGKPFYAGLELAINHKLGEFLEESAQHFIEHDFADVCSWFSLKNLLDIQLAVAYQLELFNRQSTRLLEKIYSLSEKFEETEHVILSTTKMIANNPRVHIKKMDKLSSISAGIEDSKPTTTLIYDVALTAAEMYLQTGRYSDCEVILDTILGNQFIRQNSFKTNLLSAEARHMASRLQYIRRCTVKPAETSCDEDLLEVGQQGPVELALDAFKLVVLCGKYLQEDLRSPSRQQSGLLLFEPKLSQLHFNIVLHLTRLHKHIAGPRELKAYVKEGLVYAQAHCLSLHAAIFLIELARTELLCDDEEQAAVQLNGVQGILGDILQPDGKTKVNLIDDDEDVICLPGEHNRAASPSLSRVSFKQPVFLDDEDDCDCQDCSNPQVHLVLLNYFNAQACTLMMSGEHRGGRALFRDSHSFTPKLRSKYKSAVERLGQDPASSLVVFQENVLECLLHEMESLAYSGDYAAAAHVVESVQLRNTKPNLEVQPHLERFSISLELETQCPTLVFKFIEIKSSLRHCIKAEKEKDMDDLVRDTELLSIFSKFNQLESAPATPTPVKRRTKASKAPSKRVVPSLGPGDAAGVAKDLEKLSLYTEEDGDSPVMKPRRAQHNKHRLFRMEDLVDNEGTPADKPRKPKIIITANTPMKFFKSKDLDSTPAKVDASKSTTKVDASKSTTKVDASKSTTKVDAYKKSVSKKPLSPSRVTSKSSVAKKPLSPSTVTSKSSVAKKPLSPSTINENKSTKKPVKSSKSSVRIYEDFEESDDEPRPFKTPARAAAPTSTVKRSTRSTRKEPEPSSEPASSKKSSRKPIKRL